MSKLAPGATRCGWARRFSFVLASVALVGCGRTQMWSYSDSGSEHDNGGAPTAEGGAGGTGGIAAPPSCDDIDCGENERCNGATLLCECLPGLARAHPGEPCIGSRACELDRDCDDGDACNGAESCRDGSCVLGVPVVCEKEQECRSDAGQPICACASGHVASDDGACLPECAAPLAPVISVIRDTETLHFVFDGDLPIYTAIQPADAPVSAAAYSPSSDVPLAAHSGLTRVLARVDSPGCAAITTFDAVYDVRATCAPPASLAGTTAVENTDARIVAWATEAAGYEPGPGVTAPRFKDPGAALGAPKGGNLSVVSLGDGGSITLGFEDGIANGESWDFAVFENAFNDAYLELAFVEVSSDGERFVRFDTAFLGIGPSVPAYAGDARNICGLAGSYSAAFGTPFDLDALQNQPLVRSGVVDLSRIRYVRVVDVRGDGTTLDSFERPIFDPEASPPSAGFDLDAVGVLHPAGTR